MCTCLLFAKRCSARRCFLYTRMSYGICWFCCGYFEIKIVFLANAGVVDYLNGVYYNREGKSVNRVLRRCCCRLLPELWLCRMLPFILLAIANAWYIVHIVRCNVRSNPRLPLGDIARKWTQAHAQCLAQVTPRNSNQPIPNRRRRRTSTRRDACCFACMLL